jgi:hypothetical protein
MHYGPQTFLGSEPKAAWLSSQTVLFVFLSGRNLKLMSAFIFWHVLIVCIPVNTGCKRVAMAPVFELHNFRIQAQ